MIGTRGRFHRNTQEQYPALWKYFQTGVKKGIDQRYLCRSRSPWYSQETRSPTPFLCTYMGRRKANRGKPFRFILNHSQAIVTNTYLMLYPRPRLKELLQEHPQSVKTVWEALNSLSSEALAGEGRVYGGGLHKIEPRELGNASAKAIVDALPSVCLMDEKQLSLFAL
jgi:adenine-specific DNA-methyltransferase